VNIVTDKLRSWASIIDEGTLEQALRASRLSIVEDPIALMPDAHLGAGATIGSVIATRSAIIPAAVGVDLGCGMIAVETDLGGEHLPDNLELYLPQVARDIPAGVGKGHANISDAAREWMATHPPASELSEKQVQTALEQFGSLGSGNHFFEVCLDDTDTVWLILHSGSRGIGNQLAVGHIRKAKQVIEHAGLVLEDRDLAYLMQDTPEFNEYIGDMLWSQQYAYDSRAQMMDTALRGFFRFVGFGKEDRRINCHHNYAVQETHNGVKLWVTRKGAIRAGLTDWGLIPGSMGAKSYIVKGKGNPLSYFSCAHGAGRAMSRTQAKKLHTEDDLREMMAGKVWNFKDAKQLLDEIPTAYKDIDQVMKDQDDLVEVHHVLRQVLNYKGL